ncbi:MAG: 50S ribosomal protein L6 [Holosporales bacterium]|jgi:large subunit ribosomal protein L6|nr:50S ribosomal protein L6 [Holosporales bacterium]
MSRVGSREIIVPSVVTVVRDGSLFRFEGPFGKDSLIVPDYITVEQTARGYKIAPCNDTSLARAMWGTVQRNFSNIVAGVASGFTVNLDLVGVGYKALVSDTKLVMQLGFSHSIEYNIPVGVSIRCDKPTSIAITAHSKQKVGMIAALLRSYRRPEPYNGKGVIREKEFVRRKEGKKK